MPEKERTVQTAVRLPESWIARLDAIAGKLGASGLDVSQAAAIRVCLGRGIAALEAEHGIAPAPAPVAPPAAPPERKPSKGSKPAKRGR
jgi:hypothetical protein